MAYHDLGDIDSKIIEATIEVGGSNPSNHLSTSRIAKMCGVSEFVIYNHFATKENLVSIADHKVFEETTKEADRLIVDNDDDFDALWNGMVNFFLARPVYTAFEINYGHMFPRVTESPNTLDFRADMIDNAKKYMKSVQFDEDWKYGYAWMWVFRTIITYAQFVLNKSLDDTEETRSGSRHLAKTGYVSVKQIN